MARSLRSLYGSLPSVALWRMAHSLRSFYGKAFFRLCYKANAVSELSAIKRVKRAGHKANAVSELSAISGVPTVPLAPLYYQKEEVSHGY